MGRKAYTFYADVFSYCNLRCPSCPVGNSDKEAPKPKRGLMSRPLLERIIDRALEQCDVTAFGLYNWTEPLLHPGVVELIQAVKSRGVTCWVSSNLNVLRTPEALVSGGLDFLRVSLSGFSQEVYGRGHKGGHIEAVKANMRRLSAAVRTTQSTTRVEVFYHIYRYNQHEVDAMKAFTEDLGFEFSTTFAYVMPVEKIIDITQGRITPADRQLLDGLAVPLDRAIAITSQTKKSSCYLLDDIIALDIEGNVMLCCGSSMTAQNTIANFLDHSIEELQSRRGMASLCGTCLELGIPDYFNSQPLFLDMARSD